MKKPKELTKHLKDIDNYEEFIDSSCDLLYHVIDEMEKEGGYTKETTEEHPEHWNWVTTHKGMKYYESVKECLYEIAQDNFPEVEYIELNDPMQYE